MNHTNRIKELAMMVNEGLTKYLVVHDAIFREAASFKSLLRNLIGRGVPMSKLLEDSKRLVPLWDSIGGEMESFRSLAYSSLSKDERLYFDILSLYVVAVRKTIATLVERQQLMSAGRNGGGNKPMSWEALQEKERAYRTAIEEYTVIGHELNEAKTMIFD